MGWCLFPGSSVAHVDVSVNGGPPERARLAIEREDIPALTNHRDAPIAGFEHRPDLGDLPRDARTASVEAVAHAFDGRTLRLDPIELKVAAPQAPWADDGSPAAAELRERSIRPLAGREAAPGSGDELRVLAFTHMLVHGGGSLYLLELLQRLVCEPGISCEVVTLVDGPLRAPMEALGIPVHVTDGFPVTSMARYEGNLAELVAWAAPRDFDAVLVNTLGSFSGGDLAGRLGVPAVWAVHESFTMPMFWHTAFPPNVLDPYVRIRGEQAFRNAATVVFEADATRRLFLGNAEPERLVTLPYSMEFDTIDAARESLDRAEARRGLGIEPDAQVVLCLGSIEPRKSQTMLTAAFAQIAQRHPAAQLVLVGETTDAYCAAYRESLHDYVARAGLGSRVRIEPTTKEPYRWHAVADLLVCASDIESLPRVIIEAMAFGTPVLSTRVFGVPELIEDGHTGYLCEMRNVADLSAGLDRALSATPEERGAIAARASKLVRVRHDADLYTWRIARLLRGVVADPRALPGELLAEPDVTPTGSR
jgi:glycosyltransferase involved in cell wall biosynthesis